MNIVQALAAHQRGNLADAEAIYTEILKTRPTDFDAMHLLGVVCLQTGRTEQGVELIRRAIILNQNVADAHNHLGNGLRALKRLNEALASYDRAIELNSRYADAFNNRAATLRELGRFEDALVNYRQAIASKPENAEAHNNLGNILGDLKYPEEAIASFDNVIRLSPTTPEPITAAAMRSRRLGALKKHWQVMIGRLN